jgi:phenylpyruvate tautomerase PptA (4-oxalocrotonate tautomerase family)
MPLVRIDLDRALFERKEEISDEVQQAFVDALGVVENDRFQIFHPHDSGEIVFDPTYNNVDRRSLILLQITMVHMYSPEAKRRLFEEIVRRLETLGLRHEDILISAVEVGYEDWYAGR